MAWNEPGGNNKDPWGRKAKDNSEIDNLVKDISTFLQNLFKTGESGEPPTKKNVSVLVTIFIALYLLLGIYILLETLTSSFNEFADLK